MDEIKRALMIMLILAYSCGGRNSHERTREEIIKEGGQLFTNYGCNVCHSLNETIVYGPPLSNIYMKELTVIRDSREHTLKADREYLLRAITEPGYEKDKVFRFKEMPVTSMSKEEAELLVEYLIILDTREPTKK